MLKELYVKSGSIKSTLIISIMFVGVLSQVALESFTYHLHFRKI